MLTHRPDLKIILISQNALEETHFLEYFRNVHVLHVQGTTTVVDLTSTDNSGEDLSSDDIATDEFTYVPVCAKVKAKEQTAKAAYNKARAFLNKHKEVAPDLLTVQQKKRIRRHKQTIENYERTNPPKAKSQATSAAQETTNNNDTNAQEILEQTITDAINLECGPSTSMAGVPIKRTISMDEPLFGTKRSRQGDSLEDDTELNIAVLDLSDEKGRISPDKWLLVEAKLIYDMTSEKWSKDEISFESINWHRGIKVITCRNKRSLEFLKSGIAEMQQILPSANLKIVPRSTIPTYTYASVWLPPPIPPMENILQLIKKQNDGLNTDNWKITPSANCKRNFGKEFRLVIDGSSTKHIRECQGRIKFGLGSIRVRLIGF